MIDKQIDIQMRNNTSGISPNTIIFIPMDIPNDLDRDIDEDSCESDISSEYFSANDDSDEEFSSDDETVPVEVKQSVNVFRKCLETKKKQEVTN